MDTPNSCCTPGDYQTTHAPLVKNIYSEKLKGENWKVPVKQGNRRVAFRAQHRSQAIAPCHCFKIGQLSNNIMTNAMQSTPKQLMQLARLDGVVVKNLRYKSNDARSSLAYSVFFLFNQYFKLRPFSHIFTWKPDIGRYPFQWQPLHKSCRLRQPACRRLRFSVLHGYNKETYGRKLHTLIVSLIYKMLSSYFYQTYELFCWTMNDTFPQRVFLTHKQVDNERFFIAYESESFQFFVVFGVLSQIY